MTEPTQPQSSTPKHTDPYRTRVNAAIIISIIAAVLLGWLAFSSPTQEVNSGNVTCTPLTGDVRQLSTFRTDLELEDVVSDDLDQDEDWFYQAELDAQLTALCSSLHQSRLTQVTLVSVIGATIVLLLVLAPRRENRSTAGHPV